jgi:predicted nucleic acid-binding protein
MIVLDTNVLSEIIRASPNEAVSTWMKQQSRAATFATAISRTEMLLGIQVMPEGRRRDSLSMLVDQLFVSQFGDGLLPFDGFAADHYADIVAIRRRIGRPIGVMDAQIAAIARSRRAMVATRDLSDFDGVGVELTDPWATD